jgi:hypothetical protein
MPVAFPFLDPRSTPRESALLSDAFPKIVNGMWKALRKLAASITPSLTLGSIPCRLIGRRGGRCLLNGPTKSRDDSVFTPLSTENNLRPTTLFG